MYIDFCAFTVYSNDVYITYTRTKVVFKELFRLGILVDVFVKIPLTFSIDEYQCVNERTSSWALYHHEMHAYTKTNVYTHRYSERHSKINNNNITFTTNATPCTFYLAFSTQTKQHYTNPFGLNNQKIDIVHGFSLRFKYMSMATKHEMRNKMNWLILRLFRMNALTELNQFSIL